MLKKTLENSWFVGGLWVAFLAYGFFLFNFSSYPKLLELGGGMDLPESHLAPTWEYQSLFVDRLGEQVGLYKTFQLMDLPNAILFGLTLGVTIYFLFSLANMKKFAIGALAIPVLFVIADISENVVMYVNLGNPQKLDNGLSGIFMRLTQAKLALGSISLLLLLVAILVFLMDFLGKRFNWK
ncbi:MAG: hypothetical protein R2684_06930 [Pyrinomonadaceae bacterium]